MRWMFLLLAALAFAGCLGGDTTDDGTQTTDDTMGDDLASHALDDNGTADNETLNHAPVATLQVDITNLTAVFTINVTDEDGDAVTWVLDADGNGTLYEGSGNGTVEHVYEAGNSTATLTPTDGLDDGDAVFLDVTIVAPPPALPGQTAEGSWPLSPGAPGCFADLIGFGYPSELDGLLYASFAIEPHTWGYHYDVTVETGTEQDSPGFAFLDADGGLLVSDFLSNIGSGDVPDGAATGIWWTCLGADMSGTFVSTP